MKRFAQRVKAAYEFIDAQSSFDHVRDLIVAEPDPALAAPPVRVRLRRVAPSCQRMWAADITGSGPAITIVGKRRLAETVAAVKQRLPKGAPVGVDLSAAIELFVLEPVLGELGAIAPLQLAIAAESAPYSVTTPETPPWVLERIRAARAATPSFPKHPLVSGLVRDANLGCLALQRVVEIMNADNPHAERLWSQATEAVSACGCNGVDVDAFEAAASLYLVGAQGALREAWLELRLVPASPTVVSATFRSELISALAAVPHAQRAAGIRLELLTRTMHAPMDARCHRAWPGYE